MTFDDFDSNTCEYLPETTIREIFDIADDVEMRLSSMLPCYYTWDSPDPDDPATTFNFAAGVTYIVGVSSSREEAGQLFAAATRNKSEEEMTALVSGTAESVAEDQNLSESQKETVTDATVGMFGKALIYSPVEGVGDDAAWESTHGSLVVQSGNAVFRVEAGKSKWDPSKGRFGGMVGTKLQEKAEEIARSIAGS